MEAGALGTYYQTLDGAVFEADSADELVDRLFADSRSPERDREEWMRATARRAEIQSGHRVRATDAETFVADLIAARLIERLDGEE